MKSDPFYPFLFGATRFGDCVNDEWFIVYILKTLSTLIPESVISLIDNDGDVLLIEAALDIPAWLDPSNSQNRVYLYQGQVHIIPLPTSPADILQATSGSLMRQKAIELIRCGKNTLASSVIQKSIMDRIEDYPSAALKEIHRAGCILPNQAAFVLLSEPQLITMAIEAFYLRDPISMKACATMKTFSPQSGLTETVIQFTKTTYAQTVSQKFYAPKPFRLPSVKEKVRFKFAELGMKVTCGLEMLYHSISVSSAADQLNGINSTIETYDFNNDKRYTAYVAHLTKLGYFRSEKKGSQLYVLLEKKSKEQYLQYRKEEQNQVGKKYISLDDLDVENEDTFEGSCNILSTSQNTKQRIDLLLSQYSEEALNRLLSVNNHVEDSDDWMNVDPQQLEELLMKRMGHMNQSMMSDLQKDFGGTTSKKHNVDESMDLESIMSNLENFVENSKSGIDGVEFPNDVEEDEDEDEDEDSDDDNYEDESAIQFDMEKFMNILRGTSTDEKSDLSNVMEEMDQEIYSHDKISGSFAKLSTESNENEDEVEEDEEAPVDVQLNLVKNVLESFKSQQGLPGPVGNILSQFGFVLPGDNEQDE